MKLSKPKEPSIIPADQTQRAVCVALLKQKGFLFKDVVSKNYYFNKEVMVSMPEREQLRDYLETYVLKQNKDGLLAAKPINDSTLDAVLIASATEFDLIKERLDLLPEWDEHDHIKDLSDTVGLVDEKERELFTKILKKWLTASIGQMLRTSKNELVLILSGAQGNGKTKWFEHMFRIWRGLWLSKNLNVENKDDKIMLSENVFNLWDEMTSMRRNDSESLKALLSVQDYSERKPYRRDNEQLSRIISFCGCTNNPDILKDPTGSRRFHIFETNTIDYMHNVDMQQAFSQAIALYKSNHTYWLTQKEIVSTNKRGQDFLGSDTKRELFFEALTAVENDQSGKENWMTSTKAAKCINVALRYEAIRIDQYTAINLSKMFNGLNVEKRRRRNMNEYKIRLPFSYNSDPTSQSIVYFWDEINQIQTLEKDEAPF